MNNTQKLDKLMKDMDEIKIALKGYDGQIGLIKQVENNTKSLNKLWIIVAIIGASVGGGVYGIFQLVI